MRYPCLKINLSKISNNCRIINDRCAKMGISVVGVSKCFTGDVKIAEVFLKQGIRVLGDSRLKNLQKLREHFMRTRQLPQLCLLRTPMISEIEDMVKICDISMNTQSKTVEKISGICQYLAIKHKIIIMVETDDSREGLLLDDVIPFCEYIIKKCPGIIIWGIGTNARCISEKTPGTESLQKLVELKCRIEKLLSIDIPVISGGNSSIWSLIENKSIPKGINQVRIGEAILLGHETLKYETVEGAYKDAFILDAEIIEVKRKRDAQGGGIDRIILALGIQDVDSRNISCLDASLKVVAQSSDHTVIKCLEKNNNNLDIKPGKILYYTGDKVSFKLNYFGLLSCMTTPFVEKYYYSNI